jgi:ditrans,polycis-polyprenyl diphosphate synthase
MVIEWLSGSDGKEGIAKVANFLYSAHDDSLIHRSGTQDIIFMEADMAYALRSVGVYMGEKNLLSIFVIFIISFNYHFYFSYWISS